MYQTKMFVMTYLKNEKVSPATITTLRFFDGARNSRNMTQLGPDIPGFTGGGLQYFVYKRNETKTIGQRSLGLYSPNLNLLGISGAGQEIYYNV